MFNRNGRRLITYLHGSNILLNITFLTNQLIVCVKFLSATYSNLRASFIHNTSNRESGTNAEDKSIYVGSQ
jgi:hypothetical protein